MLYTKFMIRHGNKLFVRRATHFWPYELISSLHELEVCEVWLEAGEDLLGLEPLHVGDGPQPLVAEDGRLLLGVLQVVLPHVDPEVLHNLVPGEGPLAADGRQLLAQSLRTAVDLPLHFVGGAISICGGGGCLLATGLLWLGLSSQESQLLWRHHHNSEAASFCFDLGGLLSLVQDFTGRLLFGLRLGLVAVTGIRG